MTTTSILPECATTTTGPDTQYSDTCISYTSVERDVAPVHNTPREDFLAKTGSTDLMIFVMLALVLALVGACLQLVKCQKTISHMQVVIDQQRRNDRTQGEQN